MSNILDAVKRHSGDSNEFRYKLATVEGANLFPAPTAVQLRELEQLANSLLNLHRDQTTGCVVTFASTVSGEGTSYTSYNLARYLTFMLGRKICWVDANFQRPQRRDMNSDVDFRGLLKSPETFESIKTGSNLVLVPNGNQPIRATDLLSGENYFQLIEQFRRNFYFTIIDAPPILDSVDVARIAAPTLGLVVVVQCRRLKHEVVQHAVEQMRQQDVRVLGTVLNRRTFDIPRFLYNKI